MAQSEYTFRDFLKDRGAEDLLEERTEPEISSLVLREVKLASAAFLVLVVAVALIFYQPGRSEDGKNPPTVETAPRDTAPPQAPPSRRQNPVQPVESAPRAEETPPATINSAVRSAAPEPPRPASPKPLTYKVKPGDTLEGISRRFYGVGRHWRLIADRNGIKNPLLLQAGAELKLPPPEALANH